MRWGSTHPQLSRLQPIEGWTAVATREANELQRPVAQRFGVSSQCLCRARLASFNALRVFAQRGCPFNISKKF